MKVFKKTFIHITKFQESFSNTSAGDHNILYNIIMLVQIESACIIFSGLLCEVRANAGSVSYRQFKRSTCYVLI